MLKAADAELKLVIAGNHDISLDEEFWRVRGRKMMRKELREGKEEMEIPVLARELWTGEEARKYGIRYLEEGVHEFRLRSGARLRVSGCSF